MEVISIIVVLVLVALVMLGVKSYNGLVTLKHSVSKAWVNIEVLLKQRHDELKNLIDLCKQFDINDQDLFEKILSIRTQIMNSQQMGEVKSLGAAEFQLQHNLGILLEKAKDHEELANENAFVRLQSIFAEFDRAIYDRCELYNHCVTASNERILTFPNNVIAYLFSFSTYEKLEIKSDNDQTIDPVI